MISAPNDRRSAGVSWSERWSPKSPSVVRMNPTMASMWATIQAVEANAAAHRVHRLASVEAVLANRVEEDAGELFGSCGQLRVVGRRRLEACRVQAGVLTRKVTRGGCRGDHRVVAGAADRRPADARGHQTL